MVHLDGSGSSDADRDPLNYWWSLTSLPAGSSATLSDPLASQPTFVADRLGTYIGQLIVNDGTVDSVPDTVLITAVDTQPPRLLLDPPDDALLATATPLLTVTYQDEASGVDLASLRVSLDGVEVTARFTVTATQASYRAHSRRWVPSSRGPYPGSGWQCLPGNLDVHHRYRASWPYQSRLCDRGTGKERTGHGQRCRGQRRGGSTGGADQHPYGADHHGHRYLRRQLYYNDCGTDWGCVIPHYHRCSGKYQPCDPGDRGAPRPGQRGSAPGSQCRHRPGNGYGLSLQWLHADSDGVAPGTIVPRRAAVLRGRVLDRSGAPLPGVTIAILNHPEFGLTSSRADGMFDLAVNGGGQLTITYSKAGLLSAQRQLTVPWQDYSLLPDVVLIAADPQVTTVNLAATTPIQVARGSVQSDTDGTRQATLLFRQGTQAQLRFADGSTQPLSTLSIRATEYTVGPDGPKAMPAELPPTSAYTYAVELTADEATALGATAVVFSQPVLHYVENFLGFPVGSIVPVGFYDRQVGMWIPSDNGRVIKVLSITSGLANLDLDGSGQAAGASALAALGITDAERQQLAILYTPGQSLSRVPITHFSPCDSNYPFYPLPGTLSGDDAAPDQPPPQGNLPIDPPECQGGSVIECQNQIVGEVVDVTGTPFTLHYQSDRVPGRQATLKIFLTGNTIPKTLKRIELEVRVAGRLFKPSLVIAPNQTYTFTWDGRDAYGRPVQGIQPVTVRLGYVYDVVYGQPAQTARSFALWASGSLGILRAGPGLEFILWQTWAAAIGQWDARAQGLGGWSLNAHHAYDPLRQVLYLGNGQRRSAESLRPVIAPVARDRDLWL